MKQIENIYKDFQKTWSEFVVDILVINTFYLFSCLIYLQSYSKLSEFVFLLSSFFVKIMGQTYVFIIRNNK